MDVECINLIKNCGSLAPDINHSTKNFCLHRNFTTEKGLWIWNWYLQANYLDSFQGQPASDSLEPASDGTTPQDPSDITASPATLEEGATPLSPNQTLSVGESVTTRKPQVTETWKEEERPSATAPESNSQPCNEVVPGSNLSVSTTPPSPPPVSDKLTEQQIEVPSDISTEDSPDAVQIPADKSSDIHSGPLSNSASSLTSTKQTGSTVPDLSEQTPQECDSVAKQSASEQDKDKSISHETQNLSGRSDGNESHTNNEQRTFAKQSDRKEDQAARDSADPYPVTKERAESTEVVIL